MLLSTWLEIQPSESLWLGSMPYRCHQGFFSQDLHRASVQKAFWYSSRLGAQLGSNDVSRLDPLVTGYGLSVQLAVKAGLRLAPLAEKTISSAFGVNRNDKTNRRPERLSRQNNPFCFFRIY